MKITKYVIALFIVSNLLASCTADNSVEEGIQAEQMEMLDANDETPPLDDEG